MVVSDSNNTTAISYIKIMVKDTKEAMNFEKKEKSAIWRTEYNKYTFVITNIR